MTIQIDSREKARAISKILKTFDDNNVKHYVSKLFVGDYMNLDNPRLVVDRKQSLLELANNVCQDHERFRREIVRANENGIHLIFLCEHGQGVECLEDLPFWKNPRREVRIRTGNGWATIETKAITGETLYKILSTMERKYGVEFLFCRKEETGIKIIELLNDDSRRDKE